MKYLELATKIAMMDIKDHDRNFIFGAVAIRQDGALITATNIRTQLPMPEAHCESRCLRKAGYGSILYVVRLNRNGNWAMSKPCPTCASLIKNRCVRKVFYSVSPNTYAVWNP
jgi:tRNA(Arg) A34 adenosine deaminase TadA